MNQYSNSKTLKGVVEENDDELFDNVDKYGIYPTGNFFKRIDNFWKNKFNITEEELK